VAHFNLQLLCYRTVTWYFNHTSSVSVQHIHTHRVQALFKKVLEHGFNLVVYDMINSKHLM